MPPEVLDGVNPMSGPKGNSFCPQPRLRLHCNFPAFELVSMPVRPDRVSPCRYIDHWQPVSTSGSKNEKTSANRGALRCLAKRDTSALDDIQTPFDESSVSSTNGEVCEAGLASFVILSFRQSGKKHLYCHQRWAFLLGHSRWEEES